MDCIILKSPAKVNLYLNVLNKRTDGYHNIETVFERLDLCDEIVLERLPKGIELSCDNTSLENRHNLAYKAAEAILKVAGKTFLNSGVRITIKKNIPVGAGLGGASSNAASVLKGLNELWDLRLSRKAILTIAKTLGADVAFFLSKYPFAIGRERGDRIQGLPQLILWHVLVYPDIMISTEKAYKELTSFTKQGLTRCFQYSKIKNIICALKKNDLDLLKKSLFNVFEPWAILKFPVIGQIKMLLLEGGAIAAGLSGTGSTVYGLAGSHSDAVKISSFVSRRLGNCRIFVAGTQH